MAEAQSKDTEAPTRPFNCDLCGKSFTRKSAVKRHLASKQGDSWHPAPGREAEQPRKRGPGSENGENGENGAAPADPASPPVPSTRKKPRSEISRTYNSKENVKEKNKARRQERDQRIRAQIAACDWLVGVLTVSGAGPGPGPGPAREQNTSNRNLEDAPDYSNLENISKSHEAAAYAFTMASNLPPAQWPTPGGYPGDPEFAAAIGHLTSSPDAGLDAATGGPAGQLFSWHARWEQLAPAQKRALWQRESDRALRAHMPRATLSQVSGAGALVRAKSRQIAASFSQQAFVDQLLTDSSGE